MDRPHGWGRIETLILMISVAGLAWLFLWPGDSFSQVAIGMSRAQALATVGTPPRKEGTTLPFCSDGASRVPECEEIRKTGAVYFLLWNAGGGAWRVIALDINDRVCYRRKVKT